MKHFNSLNKQAGFADLRQQIANMVSDTAIPQDEMGKLPGENSQQIKRATLHLRHKPQGLQAPTAVQK